MYLEDVFNKVIQKYDGYLNITSKRNNCIMHSVNRINV